MWYLCSPYIILLYFIFCFTKGQDAELENTKFNWCAYKNKHWPSNSCTAWSIGFTNGWEEEEGTIEEDTATKERLNCTYSLNNLTSSKVREAWLYLHPFLYHDMLLTCQTNNILISVINGFLLWSHSTWVSPEGSELASGGLEIISDTYRWGQNSWWVFLMISRTECASFRYLESVLSGEDIAKEIDWNDSLISTMVLSHSAI